MTLFLESVQFSRARWRAKGRIWEASRSPVDMMGPRIGRAGAILDNWRRLREMKAVTWGDDENVAKALPVGAGARDDGSV